jgi:hypothetical protein
MSSIKRLVPLHAVELSADPATGRIGDIYYNSLTKELRFYDGTSSQPAGGALSGILDHVHTYDGGMYSVDNIQVPNPGFIDGGDA